MMRAPKSTSATALRKVIANGFTPDELRHLAAIQEAESPGVAPGGRWTSSPLRSWPLIVGGGIPALGWWRRHATA